MRKEEEAASKQKVKEGREVVVSALQFACTDDSPPCHR